MSVRIDESESPTAASGAATAGPGASPEAPLRPALADIVIRGAREHNLQNLTLRLPRQRLIVVTGVSGSGKSSLAFDTLYAEGQRRSEERRVGKECRL